MKIRAEEHYEFSVNTTLEYMTYSSFVFQVHASEYSLTLTNTSRYCNIKRECSTSGNHVGLVQLLDPKNPGDVSFSVSYSCTNSSHDCSPTQDVLVAVVGILINGMY